MAIDEDGDVARDRHYAAHPEDRDANVVIFNFFDDERIVDESRDWAPPRSNSRMGPDRADREFELFVKSAIYGQ